MLNAFIFTVDTSNQFNSINSSVSNTISVSENPKDTRKEEELAQILETVAPQG
jgi:hypothetical protein